jgi:formate hydrogenlyase transcriptional activator
VRVSPKPIFDEAGQFRGSFGVVSDISELKQTEESLRKALTEILTVKDQLQAENIYFRNEAETRDHFHNMVGQSNAFKYVLYRALQVAPTNATVLILGEIGTGKELIAAAIHQMSSRKDRPLVTGNCAALPPNLVESELFGRENGAFTGADSRQLGRFDIANGSALCLDEIGELPMEVQAKLLRVIQRREFERLGSSRTYKVDVRIRATTDRNLG